MFFYEGYVCPVCKSKFKESEDIVACPDCGAPHHRDCWNQVGHCLFADDHGTSRQWKRPHDTESTQPPRSKADSQNFNTGRVNTCSRCGKANPEFAEFCARCGLALKPPDWSSRDNSKRGAPHQPPYGPPPFSGRYGEYTPFRMPMMDPFGGISHDENIDGIPAEDYVTFIGNNSHYYMPRFLKMSRSGSRASWNWPAFLFTPYWLLYRKNYFAGGLLLILSMLQTIINNFILAYYIQPALDMSTDRAMMESLYQLIESGNYTIYFTIISLMFLVNILVRIIFGLIGNSIYKKTAVSRIRRIREKTGIDRILRQETAQNTEIVSEYRRELAAQGGVSLILVAVASGILWFGQMLFQALIFYL